MRTARARTSAENLFVVLLMMAPPSQGLEPPANPARFTGDIGLLINIFRGWGVKFRILLDDDKGGREGKKRYRKEYLVPDTQVVTIGEIIPSLSGCTFEDLFQDDVKMAVNDFVERGQPKKRDYSLFFQDLLAREADDEFPETEMYMQQLAEWIEVSFSE